MVGVRNARSEGVSIVNHLSFPALPRHLSTFVAPAAGIAVILLSLSCATSPDTTGTSAEKRAEDGSTDEAEVGPRVDFPLELGEADADGEPGEVLRLLGTEVERTMEGLADREFPPYFLSYHVTEFRTRRVSASFGAIDRAERSERRILDTDVRVGSYALDNYHRMRGQALGRHQSSHTTGFPLDNPTAIRRSAWRAADNQYREAEQRYKKVRANKAITAPEESGAGDFIERDGAVHVERRDSLTADLDTWRERARRLSDIFSEFDALENGTVRFREQLQTRYLADAEGARVRKVRRTAHISWYAQTTAHDGMKLRLYDSADAFDPAELPSEDQLESRIRDTATKLVELRDAPKAEPFVGPAILEGEAAGVFFHEALGHRVEGHRQIDESEGQTFREKVGDDVLPRFLDVYDDPRLRRADDVPLMGHYRIDDEAVPSQRASIVKAGKLTGFLMSRQPFGDFLESNGHGRREAGKRVVARQGNLVAHPRETVSRSELKQKLIEKVKERDKPYGLRFVRVQGGFTLTQRFFPQSFRVLPLLVYRVYPDGEEELIRGVTLEGSPLTVLSDIAAAGEDAEVFNGMCGAESGRVPVSSVSPSLLVDRIETARVQTGSERPPILSPPQSTESAESSESSKSDSPSTEEGR